MFKISLTTSGLLDQGELAAWTRSRREAIHKAVGLGMRDSSRSLTDALRTRMQSDLAIRKPAFLRSMLKITSLQMMLVLVTISPMMPAT